MMLLACGRMCVLIAAGIALMLIRCSHWQTCHITVIVCLWLHLHLIFMSTTTSCIMHPHLNCRSCECFILKHLKPRCLIIFSTKDQKPTIKRANEEKSSVYPKPDIASFCVPNGSKNTMNACNTDESEWVFTQSIFVSSSFRMWEKWDKQLLFLPERYLNFVII